MMVGVVEIFSKCIGIFLLHDPEPGGVIKQIVTIPENEETLAFQRNQPFSELVITLS